MPLVRSLPFLFVVALAAQAPEPAASAADDPLATLAALPLTTPTGRSLRIAVRDANGAAATGAQVVFVENLDPAFADSARAANRRFPGDEPRYWAMRVASGERVAVDERGNARVPATNGRVLAFRDGVIATTAITVEDAKPLPRVELVLQPPLEFTVGVVTADGRPAAGAMVGVTTNARSSAFPRARTDDQGRAAFRLLPHRGEEARVRLLAATKAILERPLPASGTEVAMQLPPCGSVRATFAGELAPDTPIVWYLRSEHSFEPTSSEGRTAEFRYVEAGFTGKVHAAIHQGEISSDLAPVAEGSETKVTLARGEDQRAIALRVLDPAGAPVRGAYVHVDFKATDFSMGSSARTTGEGWLELLVPERAAGDVKVRLGVRGRSWDTPIAGQIELEIAKDATGRIDHGEQRIVVPVAALAGVLVDGSGKPLRGVQLAARFRSFEHTRTDGDGRFVFLGAGQQANASAVEVEIRSPAWFFTAPTSRVRKVELGGEVRLVLQPAGRVLLGAKGLPSEFQCNFQVRLEPVDTSGDHDKIELAARFQGGELLLPAGHWNFVVLQNRSEVHRIEGVRVDAGIEVHDARFMQFEWQSFASLVTLRIEDEHGKPFDECTVWYQVGNSGSGTQPTGGVLQWLVAKDVGTMRIEPRDKSFATVQLGRISGEHVVRIGAGPRIVVQLAKAPVLPEDAVLVAFVDDGTNGLPFDKEGKLQVWLDEPGERRVRFGLRRGTTTHVLGIGSDPFEVPAAGHTLRLDLPGLQAAIDGVGM